MIPKKSPVNHKYVLEIAPIQHKREDLAESTSMVPAKYPPKVNLELLTTLECQRGVNYVYLG